MLLVVVTLGQPGHLSGCGADSRLWVCEWGSQLLIQVRTHPRFQVWVPRSLIELRAHPGALGLCAQAAKSLIWMHTDPWLWAGAPRQPGR